MCTWQLGRPQRTIRDLICDEVKAKRIYDACEGAKKDIAAAVTAFQGAVTRTVAEVQRMLTSDDDSSDREALGEHGREEMNGAEEPDKALHRDGAEEDEEDAPEGHKNSPLQKLNNAASHKVRRTAWQKRTCRARRPHAEKWAR